MSLSEPINQDKIPKTKYMNTATLKAPNIKSNILKTAYNIKIINCQDD